MPEAPWIRRCSHGIKFTDDILNDEEEGEEGEEDQEFDGQDNNIDNSNAPKKNNVKKESDEEVETPYQQSIEVNKPNKAVANNNISEKIM